MKPLPEIPAGADMLITTYSCAAYLARLGIGEGQIVYDEVRPKRVYVADIQHRVAERFEIPVAEMKSARRAVEVARPRQVAMYLSKRHTARSLPEIGRSFGNRDHTTVIHAVRRITELRVIDHELNAAIEEVEGML